MQRSALINPKYRKFIQARDAVLEDLQFKGQLRASDHSGRVFSVIKDMVSTLAMQRGEQHWLLASTQQLHKLDQDLSRLFHQLAIELYTIAQETSRKAWLLSLVGEAEAIGRATTKAPSINDNSSHTTTPLPFQRIFYYLNKLKRKILDAYEQSRVLEDSPRDAVSRVMAALPKKRSFRKPPDTLKRVKEAEAVGSRMGIKPVSLEKVFMDEDEWSALVSEYRARYVPEWRGPDGEYLIRTVDGEQIAEAYTWELERDMVDSFVSKVRAGQIEAARQNGIKDFVWISVIDNRTDECCLWRNGLTTTEIKMELDEHTEDDEHCESTVTPPAHANCRCSLAPISDAVVEETPTDFSEFDDWLDQINSR